MGSTVQLAELERLAQREYRQSLNEVVADRHPEQAARRIGRLGGVLLKQPFAVCSEYEEPSKHNRAYTSYELLPAEEFEAVARTGPWQYHTLEVIHGELAAEVPFVGELSMYEFAEEAQNELGWFGGFARAVRPHVCGDAKIRKAVDEAVAAARREGQQVLTPETLVLGVGLELGQMLAENIPALEQSSPALVAVLVMTLYRLGVSRFCTWALDVRTDSDEKRTP